QGGVDGPVYAIQGFHNEVHAFGAFERAGTTPLPCPGWARYTLDDVPWFAVQPGNIAGVCVGHNADFYFDIAARYDTASASDLIDATLRHNGVPVGADTCWQYLWGEQRFTGDTTLAGIEICHIRPQDAGTYDVVVSKACSGGVSGSFTLGVNSADFNGDG